MNFDLYAATAYFENNTPTAYFENNTPTAYFRFAGDPDELHTIELHTIELHTIELHTIELRTIELRTIENRQKPGKRSPPLYVNYRFYLSNCKIKNFDFNRIIFIKSRKILVQRENFMYI